MANDELLNYLKRYVRDPVIVSDADQVRGLPSLWQTVLAQDKSARIDTVLSQWREFTAEFQQVVAYLEKKLEGIEIVHSSRGLSMIYSVRSQSGNIMYYEGRPAVETNTNPEIEQQWQQLDSRVQQFYTQVHNGWHYFASESLGLSPLEKCFVLSKNDWGILEQLGTLPIDLNKSLALFSNGMGDYICQEFNQGKTHTFLWFHDQEPKFNLDFWPLVDTWTFIGFEG